MSECVDNLFDVLVVQIQTCIDPSASFYYGPLSILLLVVEEDRY